jgi:hypothetical protein
MQRKPRGNPLLTLRTKICQKNKYTTYGATGWLNRNGKMDIHLFLTQEFPQMNDERFTTVIHNYTS